MAGTESSCLDPPGPLPNTGPLRLIVTNSLRQKITRFLESYRIVDIVNGNNILSYVTRRDYE